ncbi:MAG: glycosyltransferase family 39 protein [Pseudomonadota bacterium]
MNCTVMDKKNFFVFFLPAILVIGFVLRFWNIHQSFWWDELWSTLPYAGASSAWETVSSLGYYFNNHILYSLLCRLSLQFFGQAELTARLPALLMGLLGIVLLFQLGKNLVGTLPALLACFLLAVSAFHIEHSTEARGYSGFALFSFIASYYYLKALRSNTASAWALYSLFTVLGFYTHVCMVLVSLSQFFFWVLLSTGKKLGLKTDIETKALKKYLFSTAAAAITTLILYCPILLTFISNMGKVKICSVNRLPFIQNLLSCNFPGILSMQGCFFYAAVLFMGVLFLFKKDALLCLYIIVLLLLPVSLYLFINPMFAFERYFIFALPFSLMLVSCGIIGLGDCISKNRPYKAVVMLLLILALISGNAPYIYTTVTQDRQNYREAVQYVEKEIKSSPGHEDVFVFSIGQAGEHFTYYAGIPIYRPASFDELMVLLRDKKQAWCLITAWLPSIRPPYEDRALYAELPEHEKIYAYVMHNFTLKKEFYSRFPTKVYMLKIPQGLTVFSSLPS